MKKFTSLFLAAIFIAVGGINASAQSTKALDKALNKALKKEYKIKLKEYSNGGWTLFGSSHTLDVELLKHYKKINEENVSEIIGVANPFMSKAVGRQIAMNDACRVYSQNAGAYVKGRIMSDLGSDGTNVSSEFDHFYEAYERNIETEIKGELVESFCLVRQIDKDKKTGKPIYEMQAFFYVDVASATAARIRAYENALKESEAAQKYANKVSSFVREGFQAEK